MRLSLCLSFLLCCAVSVRAQSGSGPSAEGRGDGTARPGSGQVLRLDLDAAVRLARANSIDALIADNRFKNAFWTYRSFIADRRPVLSLGGTVPRFDRTIQAITQPDGSDLFIQRNQISSNLDLSLSQEVGFTGGRIFAGSGLRRIDLLGDSITTSWLSSPFFIGWQQPILKYNDWTWRRQIEPLSLEQASRERLESLEDVSVRAVDLFFRLHLAQINREIARLNLANNDTIFQISKGRYNLGKIAENDLLQIELAVLNARVALTVAENEVANATARLQRFLGAPEGTAFELVIPSEFDPMRVDPAEALAHARRFRAAPVAFERRALEAEQQVAVARGNNGFSADLFAQYGLNNTGLDLGGAYQDPQSFQNVGLTLNVPLLDWGQARSQREIAFANRDLVRSQIALDEQNFEQDVLLRVQQFNLQGNQVAIAAKADTVGRKRFEVAKARYLIGKTDITDLNIATSERDQARRAYIDALLSYWTDFYTLRRLTLYDYAADRPILEAEPELR
jgi:outer membrane protein TolC